ncbi:IS200/IS605 family transposase [Microtetraspora sp. NBRC 16547]|uniref:IS200/IS605 family transposase n=1 Tax=Microtetraspora sp. NBRC 16547 TaxID=3030993 RepID=UPI002557723C|nr:IS200/IS605 family transposase [Microtetraspora sp. NBRC 16547]
METETGYPPRSQRGPQVYSLHAHSVFPTTYRRGVFTGELLSRCEEIMIEVCDSFGAELREFNGDSDHVHLLVFYTPKVALSALVNSLKGVSARLLRKEFPSHVRKYLWGGHFWPPSYFAAFCGGARRDGRLSRLPLSIIRKYIENQKRPD